MFTRVIWGKNLPLMIEASKECGIPVDVLHEGHPDPEFVVVKTVRFVSDAQWRRLLYCYQNMNPYRTDPLHRGV